MLLGGGEGREDGQVHPTALAGRPATGQEVGAVLEADGWGQHTAERTHRPTLPTPGQRSATQEGRPPFHGASRFSSHQCRVALRWGEGRAQNLDLSQQTAALPTLRFPPHGTDPPPDGGY